MSELKWPPFCLPPDTPNTAQARAFLDGVTNTLQQQKDRYLAKRTELLNLISRDQLARAAVDQRYPNANSMAPTFWQPWTTAFTRAQTEINARRAELARARQRPCRSTPEQPQPPTPPPPPPPTGPGVVLPAAAVRPAEIPPIPGQFCSEDEKRAVLNRFYAVAFDFYLNYQNARVYHDAIAEAIAKGQGNRSVLQGMLPAARQAMDFHARRDDEFNQALARVRAMPVLECGPRTQTAPEPIPPLDFEPFVFPAVPDRFCTEAAKDETVGQLEAARDAARRNYDRATARIAELADRIGKGDNSAATSSAFQEANTAATGWLKQSEELEAARQRAEAMPVSDCAKKSRSTVSTGTGFGSTIQVGLMLEGTWFWNLEKVVEDQPDVEKASVSKSPFYGGVFVEIALNRLFRVACSALYGWHRVTQEKSNGASTTGRLNSVFLNTRLNLTRQVGPLTVLGGGGITWARDEVSEWRGVNSDVILPGRSQSGFKTNWGLGAEWRLQDRLYSRIYADLITALGKKTDGDAHVGLGASLSYGF